MRTVSDTCLLKQSGQSTGKHQKKKGHILVRIQRSRSLIETHKTSVQKEQFKIWRRAPTVFYKFVQSFFVSCTTFSFRLYLCVYMVPVFTIFFNSCCQQLFWTVKQGLSICWTKPGMFLFFLLVSFIYLVSVSLSLFIVAQFLVTKFSCYCQHQVWKLSKNCGFERWLNNRIRFIRVNL